jgi:hypothetical protein
MIGAYVDRWMPVLGQLATERKERECAAWEALEAAEPAPVRWSFAAGDQVRFTAEALRAMYGVTRFGVASYAPDQRFTAVPCSCGLCALGLHVAVDGGRHIAAVALEHASRAPQGPVWREDAAAVLEQLGLRVDEHGVYYVRPPC